MKRVSSTTLFNLKRKHDFPESTVDSIAAACSKYLGQQGVERNSSKKIKELSHSLENFYTGEKVDFLIKEKIGNKIKSQSQRSGVFQ